MKLHIRAAGFLLAAALLLSGCASSYKPPLRAQSGPSAALCAARPTITHKDYPSVTSTRPGGEDADAQGSGLISYSGTAERLSPEQENLLLSYLDMYYRSLAALRPLDPLPLFAEDSRENALIRLGAWQTTIDVRAAQRVDLSLRAFRYELVCGSVTYGDDGTVSVSALENSVQEFAAYPGVQSQAFNVRHRFTLVSTADGWRLRSHMQIDSANRMAIGSLMWRGALQESGLDAAGVEQQMRLRHDEVLASHRENLLERERQAQAYDPAAPLPVSWERDYDREAAVRYANEWVGERNPAWPAYDSSGGNCANFSSQCLYAGGIPMDYSGTSQWKWYGGSTNRSQTAAGRSASWASVSNFYTYAASNTGYGLVAQVDANYWSGEAGDLIQLGYEDDWGHVVVITEVIKDDAGSTVDYLISSNTADLKNYPVSAYMYPQHRLIRIYGWNE